jgi:5-methylcytosine-specific restriction endonuclease McrA
MKINHDWHQGVYRKRVQIGKVFKSKTWLKLRLKCLERDKYQCQVCKSYFGETSLTLQAHHIIPRKEGGRYYLENLITLCEPCHDKVEIGEVDIYPFLPNSKTKESLGDKKVDWHKFVYGGYSRH